jgi:hypothetical protein
MFFNVISIISIILCIIRIIIIFMRFSIFMSHLFCIDIVLENYSIQLYTICAVYIVHDVYTCLICIVLHYILFYCIFEMSHLFIPFYFTLLYFIAFFTYLTYFDVYCILQVLVLLLNQSLAPSSQMM